MPIGERKKQKNKAKKKKAELIRQSQNMADRKVYGTTKSRQLEGKGGGTTDPRCGFGAGGGSAPD